MARSLPLRLFSPLSINATRSNSSQSKPDRHLRPHKARLPVPRNLPASPLFHPLLHLCKTDSPVFANRPRRHNAHINQPGVIAQPERAPAIQALQRPGRRARPQSVADNLAILADHARGNRAEIHVRRRYSRGWHALREGVSGVAAKGAGSAGAEQGDGGIAAGRVSRRGVIV